MSYVTISFIVCMVLIGIWALYAFVIYKPCDEHEKEEEYVVTQTECNGVPCNDDGKCYFINSHNTSKCAFCGNAGIVAGEWGNLKCENCGANHLYGVWLFPKTIEEGEVDEGV